MRRSGQTENRGKLMFVGRPFKSRQSDGPVCIKTKGHMLVTRWTVLAGVLQRPTTTIDATLEKCVPLRWDAQTFAGILFGKRTSDSGHHLLVFWRTHKRTNMFTTMLWFGRHLSSNSQLYVWRIYWLLRRAWQHGVGGTVGKWLDSWSRWRGFKSALVRNFYSRFTITSANMAKSRSMIA